MKENIIKISGPEVIATALSLRDFTRARRKAEQTIALVPTMGALHEGHLELVRQAQKQADCVIVSIFVNPAQFGPHEDLDAYPRTWDADIEKLTATGADAVYHPAVGEIYPQGFATTVTVGGVSEKLEGAHRPGHFDGVATVVAKLFLQTLPDMALFGEKDWQQLQVIRQMTADLDIPVNIIGVPTVRDDNGLALSSRNAYLNEAQYRIACKLNRVLFAMADKLRENNDAGTVRAWGAKELERAEFDSIDYLEICDAATLGQTANGPLRVLAAVRLGKARLIDNVAVK